MKMSTTQINRNFRIKINGIVDGVKLNTLVGVSGLINLVGEEIAEKAVCKAFDHCGDSFTWKLRRGIKITFYVK